jgi:hypothetical protein
MAAARAFLALAVLLLGCWLSFFGRDWQQGPALAPLTATAALPIEPIAEASPALREAGAEVATILAGLPEETSPAPDISPAFAPTHVVRAVALHLRERPSSASPSLGSYPRGTLLMAYGREANWVEVRLADGTLGWMSVRYIDTAPAVVTAAADR